jgi:hypothetical protein
VSGRACGVRKLMSGGWCPEACPIAASIVDAGHDRADIGRARVPDVPASEHGYRWSCRGPAAQATAGLPKGAHGHCLHVRSWPGEEGGEVIGLARCIVQRSALEVSASGPSPAGRVRAHRPGGHIELGCPAGRTVGRFRHVGRPASHCPVSVRGTDRRRRCPGGCPAAAPWRKPAARLTAGMSVRHGEVLEVPARAVQGWAHEPT